MSWWQSTVVLGFAILLAVGGGVWWLYMRRAAATKEKAPDDYLTALKDKYPEAFDVLSRFERKKGLAILAASSPDLDTALGEIRKYAKSESSVSQKKSGLKISPGASAGDTTRLKAALVTIVRGIYSNPENVKSLGEGGPDALDAFLSSLVD